MFASAISRKSKTVGLQVQKRFFRLNTDYVKGFEEKKAPFGFNGLGELVYIRTYSRPKADGSKERWHETVERVVNGCFSLQERHFETHGIHFDEEASQKQAKEMFERMFNMKFLPPGRGLWAMGSAITEDRRLYAALNNCGFVSTAMSENPSSKSEPYCFLMDACMLGVGVGFDTKGAGNFKINSPLREADVFVIPDTREGWVQSLRFLLDSYFEEGMSTVAFDYSKIRKAGLPIKGFGGVSSGPDCLIDLHQRVRSRLDQMTESQISTTLIVDLMNLIGKTVISGNVRRTAEIAFGKHDDDEYIDLKNYEKNPQRAEFGWTSNNSIFAKVGMDYDKCVDNIVKNGEPGFAWIDNMRAFGRMKDAPNFIDDKEHIGGNPCLEQTLESYELCCLVETFPANHESLDDFKRTLETAFLYAKTVTLGDVHWEKSREVMRRNRRIGCSMTGIRQFLRNRSLKDLEQWCDDGYATLRKTDEDLSALFKINRSCKITSVKPSGTVSLLAGATPGVHLPENRFYIRRVRLANDSPLLPVLKDAKYNVEKDAFDPSSSVVSFPIDVGEGVETLDSIDYSLENQLSLASFMQSHWADNQVSCTVTFKAEDKNELLSSLRKYERKLKGISFLPKLEQGAFKQMPYESINQEEYNLLRKDLLRVKFDELNGQLPKDREEKDEFCDSDRCVI